MAKHKKLPTPRDNRKLFLIVMAAMVVITVVVLAVLLNQSEPQIMAPGPDRSSPVQEEIL